MVPFRLQYQAWEVSVQRQEEHPRKSIYSNNVK